MLVSKNVRQNCRLTLFLKIHKFQQKIREHFCFLEYDEQNGDLKINSFNQNLYKEREREVL